MNNRNYLTPVIEGISEAPQRSVCINAKGLTARDETNEKKAYDS